MKSESGFSLAMASQSLEKLEQEMIHFIPLFTYQEVCDTSEMSIQS